MKISRTWKFILLIILLPLLLISVVDILHAYLMSRTTQIDDVFGGRSNASIVAEPTRVEAYRLGNTPWQDRKLSHKVTPADFPIIGGPVMLTDTMAADVSRALLSPDTYAWDYAKACIPAYGVQVSFFRDAERVDVLFCFECDLLNVCRDGRFVGGEDFDHSRAVFVRAAKAAFPEDVAIQALQEEL